MPIHIYIYIREVEVRVKMTTEAPGECARPYIYIYTGESRCGAGENDDRGARKMRSAILDGSGVEAPLVLGWVRVIRISCYGDAASVGGLFGSSRRGRKACVCVCVCVCARACVYRYVVSLYWAIISLTTTGYSLPPSLSLSLSLCVGTLWRCTGPSSR